MGDFECDECGKNEVDKPGEWCNECQEKARLENSEWEANWYNKSQLCQKCSYCWGPDPNDKCGFYKMPLSMVARKKKCKHFKEIDYSKEVFEDW